MPKHILLLILFFSVNLFANEDSIFVDNQIAEVKLDKSAGNNNKKILDSFLSLIIPGYHCFAKKEYIKGSIFVANDLLASMGYFYFDKKGDEKWEASIKFANQHFDPDKYENFVDTIYHSDRFVVNPEVFVFDTLGHVLQRDINGNFIKDLNYYEMIGKYKKFVQGWDDVSPKYEDIIKKYGQIYIPISKGDSVLRYGSKYPNSNNLDLRTIPDTTIKYFVYLGDLNSVDKQMLIPRDYFFGKSNNALEYMQMRYDANEIYNLRDYMLWAILINHLSSFAYSIYGNFIGVDKESNVSFSITPYSSDKFLSRGIRLNIQF